MKCLFLISILAMSQLAFAQRDLRLEREVFAVAAEVQRSAPYLSVQQEREILENLRSIRQVLRGQTGENTGGSIIRPDRPESYSTYTCVSRDNDERAPYVLGIREGLNVTRLKEAVFSSLNECNSTLDKSRKLRGLNLICLSRDSDGRAPFMMAGLRGSSLKKFPSTVANSFQSCQSFIDNLTTRGPDITFCGSRDNDGRAPYQAININAENNQETRGTEVFTSFEGCKQFLGK